MGLESTFICVDNSEFMRNGDFAPTRLHAQQEAVSLITQAKLRSNPESNVGLMSLSNLDVLSTLTTDSRKILAKLHSIQVGGLINFVQGVKIAHLALKHRQGKNTRPRIVLFVGSPLIKNAFTNASKVDDVEAKVMQDVEQDDVSEPTVTVDPLHAEVEQHLIKLAKKLKKEKVSVDIVSFGEDAQNATLLTKFIETVKQQGASSLGGGSHLVTIPPGPHLVDALISSPIIQSEDGSGPSIISTGVGGSGVGASASGAGASGGASFEFGIDPNEDPELALALRVSMEEERARQQQQQAQAQANTGAESSSGEASAATGEEAVVPIVDDDRLSTMNEEEQIAYALRMSMLQQDDNSDTKQSSSASGGSGQQQGMDVEGEPAGSGPSTGATDKAYLQDLLSNLKGIDDNQPSKKDDTDKKKKQGEGSDS